MNKSNNKFNNYDYYGAFDDKNEEEICENINEGESTNKRIGISGSISGIDKKQAEIFETAWKLMDLLALQSHARGYGANNEDFYGDFELSEGKNNNKKGIDQQRKNVQQNQDSENIPEESDSNF